MTAPSPDPPPIRVVVQQPALPKYRIPVFAAIASRPGVTLRVEYAEWPELPNAAPDGFNATLVPQRFLRVGRQRLIWHSAQWRNATRHRADVLVVSWNTRYLSLLPALLRARLMRVPVVAWGHGVSKSDSEPRWALRALLARLATCVLFYGHEGARQYIDRGFPADRVFVAPNTIDQTPIRAASSAVREDPVTQSRFLTEHGLADGQTILFVSRLERANRVDLIVEALARLAPGRPALTLVVVGRGPDGGRLRNLARELGVEDRVRFAGPIYDEALLARYFAAATVFAYPANMGLSLLHAFGYGVPVVAGDRRAHHNPEIEALRHNENGLFFKDGDAASLADALASVLDDKALRTRLAAGAYRTATEERTLDAMVDGFLAAVMYAAGRSSPGAADHARTSRSPISAA
ncbi:MAG: glycosyltransferase [Phycisphaerae bacterium]|nr:glycosyltransferase [Phycisphaerae bacterium]